MMGCDIHLHIEVKVAGKWLHYGAPNINRWYKLFEKLAGVRGDVEHAISPPKGIPKDISTITKLAYDGWGSDAHSTSWLSIEEIRELSEWLDNSHGGFMSGKDLEHNILNTYLEGNSFGLTEETPWIEDVRFVFWFDN
jgi:hypothetical protein